MNIINISKQKIFNSKNEVYAYELIFKNIVFERTKKPAFK